jgi:hypothetical protein
MKVAVLVSGNFHPYLRRELLEFNTIRNEKIFKDFDVYYQCWDTEVDRHVFRDLDRDILWTPQPELENYDPYFLAKDTITNNPDSNKHGYRGASRFPAGLRRFGDGTPEDDFAPQLRSQGCLQHVAHELLYKEVPKDYDFYIRTRWDAYYNKNFPWEEVLEYAKSNVVGIATIPNHNAILGKIPTLKNDPNRVQYPTVSKKRIAVRKKVDQGFYSYIDRVGSDNDYTLCRWHNYVKDFCIVFKEEDMKGFNIQESYENHSLFAAEFGWHQILCREREHVNLDGLVSIYRNTDESQRAYNKLRRLGLI